MTFAIANFSPLGAQSKRGKAPAHYAYRTADALSTVMASGYFNTISSKLEVGDVINVVVVNNVTTPTSITEQAMITVSGNSSGVVTTGQYQDFTLPEITTGLNDTNGNEIFGFTATTSAVNYIQVANSATGNAVSLTATGSDTNIDLALAGKGTGAVTMTSPKVTTSINDANGNELFKLTATSSAVNEITVANSATGNSPSLTATGSDTNIDLVLSGKGTGAVKLTSPKIVTGINDTNGLELIKVTATASAVNEITVANAATGGDPAISATGDDTNVGLDIKSKGTGKVTLVADGSDAIQAYKDTSIYIGLYGATPVVQATKIADLAVTYTANDPSITPNNAITIADGSTPTVNELLEFCEELKSDIHTIIDALEGIGISAAS